jgi:hypothetical protein
MSEQTTYDRIAALESAVADLRRELEEAKRPQMRSMRASHRCPACGGRQLLRCRGIQDSTPAGPIYLSLQKVFSWGRIRHSGGVLEVYACKTCRLVEWHAATLDDVKPDGNDVIELVGTDEAAPPTTPYR